MFKKFLGIYNIMMKYLYYFAGVIISVLLLSIFCIVTAETIVRYFFRTSLRITIEYSRFALVWIAMIGGSCLFYEKGHISVDFLHKYFPPKLLVGLKIAFNTISLYFLYMVGKHGYTFAEQAIGRRSGAMRIELYYPRLAITFGAILMILQVIRNLLNNIDDLQKSTEELEEKIAEEQRIKVGDDLEVKEGK